MRLSDPGSVAYQQDVDLGLFVDPNIDGYGFGGFAPDDSILLVQGGVSHTTYSETIVVQASGQSQHLGYFQGFVPAGSL
jgi:hypothetical protein